jgi:hypothetical protein
MHTIYVNCFLAIFDGRKHTWFDIVMSEGEAEIFAWKCPTITPFHNPRVVTQYMASLPWNRLTRLPSKWNLDIDYELEYSLIRVSVNIFLLTLLMYFNFIYFLFDD